MKKTIHLTLHRKAVATSVSLVAVAGMLAGTLHGAEFSIKDGASDWTVGASYDEGTAPGPNDTVLLKAGRKVYLSAPSDSFTRVNTLDRIVPCAADAELDITVQAGGDEYLKCPFTSYGYGLGDNLLGRLVKKGTGTLSFDISTTNKIFYGNNTYAFYCRYIDVEEGVLKAPQGCDKSTYVFYGDIAVSNNATFYTVSIADESASPGSYGFTKVCRIFGDGLITNVSPNSAGRHLFLRMPGSKFDGVIGGGVVLNINEPGASVELSGTNSTFSSQAGCVFMSGTTTVEVAKFGPWKNTENSSMGNCWKFQTEAGARVVYTGRGEKTYKTFILRTSPFTIDGGPYGGLWISGDQTIGGGSEISGFYGSTSAKSLMQHLILDGSNETPCVFSPRIRLWQDNMAPEGSRTNNTLYVTKRGSGTWKFMRFLSSNWRGGVCAEEGTLQFDTLFETNRNCSFGYATMLQAPYCGAWTPASNVNYAIAFGGASATPIFEYVGTNFVSVTTRPIAIRTKGCIVNSGTRRFRMSNVSGLGSGPKELILGGSSKKMDEIDNISDGDGVVSVTKTGSGDWRLGGNLTFSGRLKVDDGTLYVHDGKHYSWFKWTVRQTHWKEFASGSSEYSRNYAYRVSEFALYDSASNRVNLGMSAPAYDWDVTTSTDPAADATTDYMALAPNSAAIGRYDYRYDIHPLTFELASYDNKNNNITLMNKNLAAAFDGIPANNANETWGPFARSAMQETSPKYWLSLFLHATNAVRVSSYDWAEFQGASGWTPTSWIMEASMNGFDWDELDTKSGVISPKDSASDYNYWSCMNEPGVAEKVVSGQKRTGYPIPEAPARTPPQVLNNAMVSVGANGRLVIDGDVTVSRLEVDAAGAGTIEHLTFAENGVLNVVNLPNEAAVVLPGTYVACTGFENVRNWQLLVDGERSPRQRLAFVKGKLVVIRRGLAVSFR